MTNIFENGGEFCTRGDAKLWQRDPTFKPRAVEWHCFKGNLMYPVSYAAETDCREVDLAGRFCAGCVDDRDLVPMPTPPQLVPWSGPQDVPENCWIRNNLSGSLHKITGFSADGRPLLAGAYFAYWELFENYEHAASHLAKEWFPCGKLK